MRADSIVRRIAVAVKKIPRGKVATYGQIAALAGNPRDARAVGWVLNSHWKSEKLPWQRVINREGKISLKPGEGYELQKALLEQEGVQFDFRDRIDLSRFQWQPRTTARSSRSSAKSKR